MRPKNFDANKLTEDLQGTCKTIDDNLPDGMEFTDLTSQDHVIIDTQVFCCEQCGWWCEISEQNKNDGDYICDDCYEDNN